MRRTDGIVREMFGTEYRQRRAVPSLRGLAHVVQERSNAIIRELKLGAHRPYNTRLARVVVARRERSGVTMR